MAKERLDKLVATTGRFSRREHRFDGEKNLLLLTF